MAKIYTKKGDFGTTTLLDGLTLSKDHPRITACGAIDELNSSIGIVLSDLRIPLREKHTLTRIQYELLEVGSELGNLTKIFIDESYVSRLEKEIDLLSDLLPPLNKFILPSGNFATTTCHLARTICRRAEQSIVTLSHQDKVNPNLLMYINRLSDLLFMIARILAI